MRVPVQVFLEEELKSWLSGYALRHNLSMTTVVQILLERERLTDEANTNGKPLFAAKQIG